MKAISVHLTDQCNNSCIFCVVDSHQEKKEGVNKKILYKFLEENADCGYECVNIHGGEATVLNDFEEILTKIQKLNYKTVSLQTNGRKLADMDYAKSLFDKGVRLFVVSIHGDCAEEHDYITQVPGSFDEAIQGIKNVKALGGKVRTNTVVYKKNMNKIKNIVEMIMDCGVDHINISGLHPVGKAYKNFHNVTPKYVDIMDNVFEAVNLCEKRGHVVTLEGFPLCLLKEYEKYIIQWEEVHFKLLYHNYLINDYAEFMENQTKKRGEICEGCNKTSKCGGVYKEYLEFYGWGDIESYVS